MTITLAEIDRWDPETLDQVFDRCQRIGGECVRLDDELGDLSKLDRWGGEAAEAARISIGKVRVDVGDLMAQSFHIRRAVDSAQSEIEAVKLRLEAARQTAIGDALSISPEGIVSEDTAKRPDMSDWTLRRIENFTVQKAAQISELQAEIDAIRSAAADADEDLAAAILGATGQVGAYEMNRDQTSRDAFRRTFNRDPVSEADWKTAAMLNTTSYDPKHKGLPAEIVVSTIAPVPGQGVVRLGLFIPSETVFNMPDDDLGDNRGFDRNFGPVDTRATVYIDYENGIVITRQTPSVQADGQVKVGKPSAQTWQLPDGTVMVKYSATNPYAPPGSELADRVVRGSIITTPGANGPELYGHIGDYPSAEAYSERAGEPTRTLLTDEADDTGPYGPLLQLGSYHLVGEKPDGFDDLFENKAGPGSRAVVPQPRVDGTDSGSASNPPQTVIVR